MIRMPLYKVNVKEIDLNSPLLFLEGRSAKVVIGRKPVSHLDRGDCIIDWELKAPVPKKGHLELKPPEIRNAITRDYLVLENNIRIRMNPNVRAALKNLLR